jgi:hypothetical protein
MAKAYRIPVPMSVVSGVMVYNPPNPSGIDQMRRARRTPPA